MSRQYSYTQMHSTPRASARRGNSIRDLVADWKKWSPAERVLAVVVGLLVVAVPFGVLLSGRSVV